MLLELNAALLALAALIDTASIEVRIASPALASEPVLAAVERARQRGVPVKVLLGATPQYTVDAHGALSGPNRPFDKGPQGAELARLDAARAQTYIPPRFNEVGSDGLQRGVQAHMAYAVVDVNQAMVCMAPLTQPAPAGLCVQTDARHARALAALHEVDHDYTLSAPVRRRKLGELAPAGMVATPEMADGFTALLPQPWGHMLTSLLTNGQAVDALLRSPYRPVIWLAAGAPHSSQAVTRLRAAGFAVQQSPVTFDGTLLIASRMVFLGSQRMDQQQLRSSRDVGVLLPADFAEPSARLSAKWRATSSESAGSLDQRTRQP